MRSAQHSALILTYRKPISLLAVLMLGLGATACTTLSFSSPESDEPQRPEAQGQGDDGHEVRLASGVVTEGRSNVSGDLAFAEDDRSSVTRSSSFQILPIPGVGAFYMPAHTLKDMRAQRSKARARLKDHPEDPWALRAMATYELAIGNPHGAKTYVDVARGKGLGFEPESSLVLAMALVALGQSDQAAEEFARAETTEQGFLLANINQGMQALQRGNASVAATHFSRAVSRDGRHVMARIHLGQAYYLMRMHTQAIKQLDEALVVDPSNLLAHYNRAIVLHRGLREFKRARDSLEIVLSAPETGSSLRKKALGAVRNLDRDAQGRDNLATIGSF